MRLDIPDIDRDALADHLPRHAFSQVHFHPFEFFFSLAETGNGAGKESLLLHL